MKLIDLYKPIRRNSYILVSALILGVLSYFMIIRTYRVEGLVVVVATALFLLTVWLALRPGESDVVDADAVISAVGNGRPTFLNVYSNT